jgi:CHAT domain-containing protein
LAGTRGLGFVPLPGSRGEVEHIESLFKQVNGGGSTTTLLGPDASEQTLDQMAHADTLRQFRYLHFATHAVFNDQSAMNSALILSQDDVPDPYERLVAGLEVYDGKLTADQITRTWKLDADLVTLSACKTALGRRVGGEGMIGFSQALFIAGARSLLLSLWEVDDVATQLLLTRFYENLLGHYHIPRDGVESGTPMSKAKALREAKNWLRQASPEEIRATLECYETTPRRDTSESTTTPSDEAPNVIRGELDTRPAAGPRKPQSRHDYSHPYYWAGFILIGDPD